MFSGAENFDDIVDLEFSRRAAYKTEEMRNRGFRDSSWFCSEKGVFVIPSIRSMPHVGSMSM